jgi:glutathione S-transferase
MFFEQYELEINIAVVRFWVHVLGGVPDGQESVYQAKLAAGHRTLEAMERHLADGREWFVGDGMTLADIALYAYTHVAHEGGFELDRFPAVRSWLARVADVPGHVPIDA